MAERNNPYLDDGYFDHVQSMASNNVRNTALKNPDEAAREATLARTSGAPLATVQNDPAAAKRFEAQRQADIAEMSKVSPLTVRTLADPQKAGIIRDDTKNLAAMEQRIAAGQPYFQNIRGVKETPLSWITGISSNVYHQGGLAWEGLIQGLTEATGGTAPQAEYAAGAHRQALQLYTPDIKDPTRKGIYSGTTSLAQALPAIAASIAVANPAPAIAYGMSLTGGQSYSDYRYEGYSPGRAGLGAGAQAGIEGVTELLPMGFVADKFGKTGVKRFISELMFKDMLGEQAATAGQDAVDVLMKPADKQDWDKYIAERPAAAYQTALAVLTMSGAIGATHAGAKLMADRANLQASLEGTQTLNELHKLSAASKVRARDSRTFEEFVTEATKDGPLENVYIEGADLLQVIAPPAEGPVDMNRNAAVADALAQLSPEVQQQIAQAQELGQDVVIPTSEFMKIAGTPLAESLLPHLKTDPAGFSQVQAQQFIATEGARLKEAVAKVLESDNVDSDYRSSAENVKSHFVTEFNRLNRFTPDVNELYATVASRIYATQAQRVGWTPEEMLSQHPLHLTAEGMFAPGSFSQGNKPITTKMTPDEYLDLVLNSEGREILDKDTKDYDPALDEGGATTAPVHLRVNEQGRVVGYDGRHRMTRLIRAGKLDEVEVELRMSGRDTIAAGEELQPTRSRQMAYGNGVKPLTLREVLNAPEAQPPAAEGVFAQSAVDKRAKALAEEVPGLTQMLPYLLPDEKAKLRRDTAAKMVALFKSLPSAEEMASVAWSGRAKRGWYESSAHTLLEVFGLEDATRFAALLAATSPQTSVESNARNALGVWTAWIKAGKPQDREAILDIMAANVEGEGGRESILPAWVDNTMSALLADNPAETVLSGPKVNSFMLNLVGVTDEVTNDAWMANYALIKQAVFAKTGPSPGKGAGYMTMSALTRRAATIISRRTGETWTPAEVQETVWSWARTLYNLADSGTTAQEILAAGGLTAEDIGSTPDFSLLFLNGVYRSILEAGGYGEQLDNLAEARGRADGSYGRGGDPLLAEGSGLAEGAYRRHLALAAKRLDQLRVNRAEEKAAEAAKKLAKRQDTLEQGPVDAPLQGMPTVFKVDGVPVEFGPHAPAKRAAEAYAEAADLPFNPPTDYARVDPDVARLIARAYDEMVHDPQNPETRASYQAMADETLAQWEAIKATGLVVEFIPKGSDPYGNPRNAILDVTENNHLWVFPTEDGFGEEGLDLTGHPMLNIVEGEEISGRPVTVNDIFRIVHDYFGHITEGVGFRADGEENAWRQHSAMYTPLARKAMTTETRGQNSWLNFGPHGDFNRTAKSAETRFAPQKIGLLPQWVVVQGSGDSNTLAQSAWHGSPHKFDHFSLSAIGTGEGAQAFGYGHYFAGKREIAEYYKDKLAGQAGFEVKVVKGEDLPHELNSLALNAANEAWFRLDNPADPLTVDDILFHVDAVAAKKTLGAQATKDPARTHALLEQTREALRNGELVIETSYERKGRLYEVDIPEDHEFLLYDEPLSAQPPGIQEALARAGFDPGTRRQPTVNGQPLALALPDDVEKTHMVFVRRALVEHEGDIDAAEATYYANHPISKDPVREENWRHDAEHIWNSIKALNAPIEMGVANNDPRGAAVYELFGKALRADAEDAGIDLQGKGRDQLASEALHAAGVRGIKYKDGSSRNADGEPTYNYVVFSDDDVDIKAFEQPAWHGSPHLHEKFSTDKIGTGEGAQAYGWGLYFAGRKGVAAYYRNALSRDGAFEVTVDGKRESHSSASETADLAGLSTNRESYVLEYMLLQMQNGSTPEQAVAKAREDYAHFTDEERASAEAAFAKLDPKFGAGGRLYKVDIPEDDEFLLHDAPFSEQSPKVQAALKEMGLEPPPDPEPITDPGLRRLIEKTLKATGGDVGQAGVAITIDNDQALYKEAQALMAKSETPVDEDDSPGEWVANEAAQHLAAVDAQRNYTGAKLYRDAKAMATEDQHARLNAKRAELKAKYDVATDIEMWNAASPAEQNELNVLSGVQGGFRADRAASEAMHEAGIAGIKYEDQGSRDDEGNKTYNYVVFSDENVDILSYEQAAPSLTPAVKVGGKVYAAEGSHLDAWATVPPEQRTGLMDGNAAGYVNHKGQFLNRRRAADYARENDLIQDRYKSWAASAPEIPSEWLKPPTVGQPQGWDNTGQGGGENVVSPQTARGLYNPGTSTLTVLKNADLSTVLHELGHHQLEVMAKLAAMPNAPPGVREDMDTILKWFMPGMTLEMWNGMTLDQQRPFHEKFARGFEAYLFEGKAPNQEMRGIFQKTRAWMLQVYKQLEALGVTLTPEVRDVFDRIMVAEENIGAAEFGIGYAPVFDSKPEGMTDAQWRDYQTLGAEATADAVDELQTRSLRDMRWASNARDRMIRQMQAEERDKRKEIKRDVAEEVNAEPVNMARTYLKRGTVNGEAVEAPHKLHIPDLEYMYPGTGQYPEGSLPRYQDLGYGNYGMLSNNGRNPAQVAELFGFDSADALVQALLNEPAAIDKINAITDRRMLETYGDLTDADSMGRAADEALHNDTRLRFVATEMNTLAKMAGKPRILAAAAKAYASEMIARMKVRDIKPGRFTEAEKRASRDAAKAMKSGDVVLAATQKRNQLINGYAAKAALDAQTEVEKMLRYFKKFSKRRTTIDPEYQDQIDTMLERFDLRTGASLKSIDQRKSLKEWVEAQEANGTQPVIAQALLNEANRKHFKDMTLEEMRGLQDAIRSIEHLGRLKQRLLTAQRDRAFQKAEAAIVAEIEDNAYQVIPEQLERNTLKDTVKGGISGFFAAHRKFASYVRQMSGFKDGSAMWQYLVRNQNKASDAEATMIEGSSVALDKIFAPIYALGGKLRVKMFIPEIGNSLSLEGRLMVALNWGNEGNRARIMDGDNWSEDQVQAILATITDEQWDFVQQVWDHIDSYWPAIAAKQKRVEGIAPEKVEASGFVTPDGRAMRGGYFPIKYDPHRSDKALQDNEAEVIKASLLGSYTAATTRRGHTEARLDKVERPVRKDFGVIFQHISQVAHDLAWHEYLIDANRLLKSPKISKAIRDHYGQETLNAMRKTMTDIAAGNLAAADQVEKTLNYLRSGATIAGLAWNLTTALMQPLGLTQSMSRIGTKWVARGLGTWLGDATKMENKVQEIHGKSEFMRLRHKTMQREINEIANKLSPTKNTKLSAIEDSFFYLIGKMQMVADIPTWLGEYEKQTAAGKDDAEAVALADQAVLDAQGGGAINNLAGVQRGSAAMKLFTNFYSYMNVVHNLMAESIGRVRKDGAPMAPRLVSDTLLLMVIPTLLTTLLRDAMKGGDDDEPLWKRVVKDQFGMLLGTMVGFRELAGLIGSEGRYAGPAGLRFFSDSGKLYQQILQGEMDESMLKAANSAAGVLFHYPSGQVQRTLTGLMALTNGDTKNPLVLVSGAPKKKSA